MNLLHRLRRALAAASVLLLPVLLLGPATARAEPLGPGHIAVPGFSGYVTRGGAELGIGQLANGVVGVCLDTGPDRRWPTGAHTHVTVAGPEASYLLTTYLGRARTDGHVAAALWWAIGGTLGLNSHPERVRRHVETLRAEAPGVYASVRAWHDRMLASARRDAPRAASGYRTGLHLTRTTRGLRVQHIGVRSATGHWIGGRRVRLTVTGARFANGATSWTGLTRRSALTLDVHHITGHVVTVRERVMDLPATVFLRYAGGDSVQRVAAAAPTVAVHARASLARAAAGKVPAPVSIRVVKRAEGNDDAGVVGVRFEVRTRTGHVLASHTFDRLDVTAGVASFTTAPILDPTAPYVVAITAEPAGWVPELTTVAAVRSGSGFVAHLVDDRVWQPHLSTLVSEHEVTPGSWVHDTVTVRDSGGDALTGQWRLLGPVLPGSSGCVGLDWSHAPVVDSGGFDASGDGTISVGEHRVDSVGCYTYTESMAGNRTTLPVPWTTAGQASETTLVRGVPRLTTMVIRQRVTAGTPIIDRVSVRGLGSGSPVVSGQWQLLGPVAPDSRHRCRGLSWRHAPVAAHGDFTVRHDGTIGVGRHRPAFGGCYTYRERLSSTVATAEASWTRPGIAAETTVATPRQPRVPAHPRVPAGGSRAALAGRSTGSIRLRATGLDARVGWVDFDGDDLTPPGDIRRAGVWARGARLDAVVGTTVVVGHVSDLHDRPGAFHRLLSARRGETIVTTTASGRHARWRIVSVVLTPKRALSPSLFRQGLGRRLILVTCGNEIHYPNGHFHYRSNLVVTAVPR